MLLVIGSLDHLNTVYHRYFLFGPIWVVARLMQRLREDLTRDELLHTLDQILTGYKDLTTELVYIGQ